MKGVIDSDVLIDFLQGVPAARTELERYRQRHSGRYGDSPAMAEKRKNDAVSLDELEAEVKPKRGQNPRYVLIGDGEVVPAEDADDEDSRANELEDTDTPRQAEPEPRRFRDDRYV